MVQKTTTTESWAIVTPSYKGDFERCQLLCKSLDAFVTGNWHHYIVVEKIDLALFMPLQGPRRSIVHMETILPKWLHHLKSLKIANNRSIWFGWRTGFMVGWQIQQLVKLEMAFQVKESGLLYCDSDIFFVRPLDVSQLTPKGKFRFYRTEDSKPRETASSAHYMIASSKQLGLGKDPFPCRDYVTNAVPWHAATARALCEHIATISGKDWKVALGRHFVISEYSLYGLFVERVLKDRSIFSETGDLLCKTLWLSRDIGEDKLDDFCDALSPGQVALGFQSFAGISKAELAAQLNRAIDKYALKRAR